MDIKEKQAWRTIVAVLQKTGYDKLYDEEVHIVAECLRRCEQQCKKQNLIDLGFYQDEPLDFKFDTGINKPVLCKRCDNYYYAYPTKTGWVYYRSRYLGERDKEIIDITFYEWAYKVLEEVSK